MVTHPQKARFITKLLANKAASFGMILIIINLLLGCFCYFIAPDHSPNANRMVPEISSQQPGYRCEFLLLKTEKNNPPSSLLHQFLSGKELTHQYIPIKAYQIVGDSLVYEKMVDEGITEQKSILLSAAASQPVKQEIFYLGTDKFGRDILSRLLIGVRVSLAVGFIAVLISLSIGILMGSLAGYFGGRVDAIVMWFINVFWSIPTLLLVFAITIAIGKGFWQVFIAVGLTMWVNVARLVRGQVMGLKELTYIEATKALGYSTTRILLKHILPNILGPVMVIAASNFAAAIVIEAGLSFLGMGVQPPQPSWGLLIKENYNFIITNQPLLAIIPGLAIMQLVLAFNLLGNGLRDAMQVKSNAS